MKIKVKKKPPTDVWELRRDGVTQSLIGNFLTCPEKARLRYVKGYREKKPSEAIQFGDVFHKAMDAGYSYIKDNRFNLSQEEAANVAMIEVQRIEASKILYPHEDLEMLLGTVEATIPGYFLYWGKKDIGRKWIALEEEIEVEITIDGVTFLLRAKLDGLFELNSGRWVLKETKTKGRIDETAILTKLNIDFQTLFYLWLIRAKWGVHAGKVLYDVVRRTQLRQKTKTGETVSQFITRVRKDIEDRPNWYFMRFNMSLTESELDEWAESDLMSVLRQLVRWSNKEFNYRNSWACSGGSFPCPFLRVCTMGDKTGLIKVDSAHSELGQKT